VQVNVLSNVTAIACGGFYTVALRSDGTVWAWGENINGQLGDGTNKDKKSPVLSKEDNGQRKIMTKDDR
jgi:alpha-tubulin suppressor-like RCC1 family protein